MPYKRKAASDAAGRPSKSAKHAEPSDGADADDSDVSFEADSVNGTHHDVTPATPLSVTSSKYPSELKTHLCPFDGCTKAFNRPARLQEHIRSHKNERVFKCSYDGCDKTFLRASHLNHHIKSAHTAVRDYVCDRPGCGKSFVTGTRLRRHLAAHDGSDKFRCTEYPPCNETFRKHSTLNKHILLTHLNQKPFPCQHVDPVTGECCQQAFESAAHLRSHENRVHPKNRFTCTECASASSTVTQAAGADIPASSCFSSYAELQAHIKSAHPPRCLHCSFACSTSRELRRHLEIAHGDVSLEERRQFPCTIPNCGRSFTKKGNLTVHIRTVHDGEKRFVCGETDLSSSKKVEGWAMSDGCGKRYGSKLALEEHVRTAHLGLLNTKAERRERLGDVKKQHNRSKSTNMSTIALLTGEGYADESGRNIVCFVQDCEHRFYREYDLWVHMQSKHGCAEDDIENMFIQRALLQGSQDTVCGIYGLGMDAGGVLSPDPGAVVPSFPDLHITGNEFDEKINDMVSFDTEGDGFMQGVDNSAGLITEGAMQSKNDFCKLDPNLFDMTGPI